MSDRQIDPTRQGITHEPESDEFQNADPVSLDEAMAAVASWADGMPLFRLHRIAQRLRDAVWELKAD